jgi:hypothetical protein
MKHFLAIVDIIKKKIYSIAEVYKRRHKTLLEIVLVVIILGQVLYLVNGIFSAKSENERLYNEVGKIEHMLKEIYTSTEEIKREGIAIQKDPIYIERLLKQMNLSMAKDEYILKE